MGSQVSSNYSTSPQALKFIQSVVHQNCVVIFSKTDCPYSKHAKKIFTTMGIDHYIIELDLRDDCEVLQNALMELTGGRTVPRVFINGNCIGGGIDAEKLHKQGRLGSLVGQCGQTRS